MFSLTPEEKKELLRLLKLAQDCDQLLMWDSRGYARPSGIEEDGDGDVVISVEDFQ